MATRPLKDIVQKTRHPAFPASEVVWNLNLDQIESGTGRVILKQLTVASSAGNSTHRFAQGTVLYSKLRPYLNKVVVADEDGVATTELVPLAIRPDVAVPEYVAQYLRSDRFLSEASERVTGAKMPRVIMDWFWSHEIPIPPIEEQRRIAELLDEADRLQRLRKDANEKAQRILTALFVDMFGSPETNPMGWEVKPLSDAATIQIGPFGSLLHQQDYVEGGIPLINPKHIQDGRICPSTSNAITPEKHQGLRNYHLHSGDVVMGRRGEMGRCAVVGEKEDGWLCGTGSLIIRPLHGKSSAPYLASLLSHSVMKMRLESLSLGLTLPNLNATIVQNLMVMLPPNERQDAFQDALSTTEEVLASQSAATRGIAETVAALRSRLFADAV